MPIKLCRGSGSCVHLPVDFCILIVACFTFFCVLPVAIFSSFSVLSLSPDCNGRSIGEMIKGQMQVGLLMFLGSTLRLAFVEGFSVHIAKKMSYVDGSSRL
ncbi:hypothetical protein Bca52824_014079 [Brassica carinata]|uniref:Uncharacterized protein n=1 Tax=Brassica carinata TaxID=52824 RepID=A0A8X7W029_BRACI|nr:hypothetical protein Bca52824_014079 [Brassica carinata]